MDKFVDSITMKYQERRINCEKQWPPCHSSKLVRLELIEKQKELLTGRKSKVVKLTPLAYGDIFKVESGKKPVRKVLVEGDAGIGKTTLCTSVSEDWANGRLFQQFKLLLLLPLHHKEIATTSSLPDLFKLLHPSSRICDSVANYIEEEDGKNVLIIADGWDELRKSEREEGSFLYKLLFQKFPLMSVLLTSRPYASAPLHRLPNIDRLVQLCGFNKEKTKEYIVSEFSKEQEKADRLLEQLESNPLVESVCSVPLSCAIVCYLWRILEEALPTTMTELYTKIILNVILRNICKIDTYSTIMCLPSFDSIPESLQQAWWCLCEFAFQTMEQDQVVFFQEELVKFFPQELANIHCFGLLQQTECMFETGRGVSFHYLHLTFQEYLAALHLVKLPPDKQLMVFQSHSSELNASKNLITKSTRIWRFFFGIYFSRTSVETSMILDIDQVIQYASGIDSLTFGIELTVGGELFLCHCAFEARNKMITDKIIQYLKKDGYFSTLTEIGDDIPFFIDHTSTAHDCAAVLYIISNMEECSDIIINFHKSGIREDQIKTLTDALGSRHGKLQVTSLNLHGNELSDRSVSDLFHKALAAFQSLISLDLSNTGIGAESVSTIKAVVAKSSLGSLVTLDLSHNPLGGSSALKMIEDIVHSSSLAKLQKLHLQGSFSACGDADISNSLLTSFLESLSSHCQCLEILDLSQNKLKLTARGVSALARIISQCRSIKLLFHPPTHQVAIEQFIPDGHQIYLSSTKLGDEGLSAFVEGLKGSCQVSILDLVGNGIHYAGVSSLAVGVCSGKIVIQDADDIMDYLYNEDTKTVSLHLDFNPLGLKGTEAISRMLSSDHCQITKLTLCGCQLTTIHHSLLDSEAVGKQLCQMPHCSTLTHLYLDYNCFTGEGIHILAGFMHLCPRVRVLSSDECRITSDDLRWLLDRLVQLKSTAPSLCSGLMSWYLNKNNIDDSGMSALIDHLQAPLLFPISYWSLNSVHLDDNPVSSEMMARLEKELKRRQEVRCYVHSMHVHVCQITWC